MKRVMLCTFVVFLAILGARPAVADDFPRLLSYDELMKLPPEKREIYLSGVREIFIELAKMKQPNLKGLFAENSAERWLEIASALGVNQSFAADPVVVQKGPSGLVATSLEVQLQQARAEEEEAQTKYNELWSNWLPWSTSGNDDAKQRWEQAKRKRMALERAVSDSKSAAPTTTARVEAQRERDSVAQSVQLRQQLVNQLKGESAQAPAGPEKERLNARLAEARSLENSGEQQLADSKSELRDAQHANTPQAQRAEAKELRKLDARAATEAAPPVPTGTGPIRSAGGGGGPATANTGAPVPGLTGGPSGPAAQRSGASAKAPAASQPTDPIEAAAQAAANPAPNSKASKPAADGAAPKADPHQCSDIAKDFKCDDYSQMSSADQSTLKQRLYREHAAQLKLCNIGGNWSTYKGGRGAQGKCQEQYTFCFSPGNCQINGKKVGCHEKGKALCNPMVFGVHKDGSAFCEVPNTTMSESCDKPDNQKDRMTDFLNKDQPGIREKWNKDVAGNFRQVCMADQAKSQVAKDIVSINCLACKKMAQQIRELNKRVTDQCDLPADPNQSGPAPTQAQTQNPAPSQQSQPRVLRRAGQRPASR